MTDQATAREEVSRKLKMKKTSRETTHGESRQVKLKMENMSCNDDQVTAHEEELESRKSNTKMMSRNNYLETAHEESRTMKMKRTKETSHNDDQVTPHEEELESRKEITSDIDDKEVVKETRQKSWKDLEKSFELVSVSLASFRNDNTATRPPRLTQRRTKCVPFC